MENMEFIRTLVENWKAKREAKAAAKRTLAASFFAFVDETRPLTPKAEKYPQAALYRHAWKRAVVLADIAAESYSEADVELFTSFRELAGNEYLAVAPSGPYGKVRLALSGKARARLHEFELERIRARARLAAGTSPRKFKGVVYLLRSGGNYKIGRSSNIGRRIREIRLALPDPPTRVQDIQTNDPVKIEKHWHNRFAGKRKGGEWFELTDEDVAEFKKHTQM